MQNTAKFQYDQMKLANMMQPGAMTTSPVAGGSGTTASGSDSGQSKIDDDNSSRTNAVQKPKKLTVTEIKK